MTQEISLWQKTKFLIAKLSSSGLCLIRGDVLFPNLDSLFERHICCHELNASLLISKHDWKAQSTYVPFCKGCALSDMKPSIFLFKALIRCWPLSPWHAECLDQGPRDQPHKVPHFMEDGGGGVYSLGRAPMVVGLYSLSLEEHPSCGVHDCLGGSYCVWIVVEHWLQF